MSDYLCVQQHPETFNELCQHSRLHLCEALALSGDKAGAAAALGKVGGSLSEIAKFWLVYANRAA